MADSVVGRAKELFRTTYLQAVDVRRCYSGNTSTTCPRQMKFRVGGLYSPRGPPAAEVGLRMVVMICRSCRSAR
jgi:hypothetical protein